MTASPPLPVVVNRGGGSARARGEQLAEDVERAFAAAGRDVVLELVDGEDIATAISRHCGASRVVIGGGDGTVGGTAGLLAKSGSELAVLPLGTRNHLARQLGIPLDLAQAASLAATGRSTAIDLATAGDRTFVNNASLGAYVDLVRLREGSSLPKWLASITAGWRVLRKLRPTRFELALDGEVRSIDTVMLFIGNNLYEVLEGKPGERAALDDGLLSVFALAPMTRGGLFRAALRVAFRRPDLARDFALETTARKVVLRGEGTASVALDGERIELPLPLMFAIRPRALRIVSPDA